MLEPLAPWYAAIPRDEWILETDEDRVEFEARWDPVVGDRQTEIVFIGIDMDEASIRRRLDACVLVDSEFEQGPEKWLRYPDPLPDWDISFTRRPGSSLVDSDVDDAS